MASSCDVYHTLCPPNLNLGLFQSIRTQTFLTSTRTYVNFWISYLLFWLQKIVFQFLQLLKPIILPFLLYYANPCDMKPSRDFFSPAFHARSVYFLCFRIQIYVCWSLSSLLGCNTKRGEGRLPGWGESLCLQVLTTRLSCSPPLSRITFPSSRRSFLIPG